MKHADARRYWWLRQCSPISSTKGSVTINWPIRDNGKMVEPFNEIWGDELDARIDRYLDCYPPEPPVIHGKRKGPQWIWWAIHNIFAHPIGELLYWVGLKQASDWLHDETLPIHEEGTGRG